MSVNRQLMSLISLVCVFSSLNNVLALDQKSLETGGDGRSTAKESLVFNSGLDINKYGSENFLLIDKLNDGEMERRISLNGISAKETSVANSSKSLSLWQLSNGKGFIQMIFTSDKEILDCEFSLQKSFVRGFQTKFYDEYYAAKARNFTTPDSYYYKKDQYVSNHEFRDYLQNNVIPNEFIDEQRLDGRDATAFGLKTIEYRQINSLNDLSDDLRDIVNYDKVKEQCDNWIHQMRNIVDQLTTGTRQEAENASEHLQRKKRSLSDWLMAPNTKWCGRGQSAGNYNQLGGASKADKCCRRHDHCKYNIHAMTSRWDLFNFRPFTISMCNCDARHKRDLDSFLRVPGTKWCGKGWTATKYSDMGGLSKADRCCRQHDMACPHWILGFQTKYGLFNWRINTIMHCKCDERFRTCLKMANSPDANMVGKLFFNVVQTKCFNLKRERVCKKRSLKHFGKCKKYVYKRRAHLMPNRKF